MPGLRVAVASGNWSNPATWDFGVLPVAGDIVCANGFTVNIDQSINVGRLTTVASSVISAVPIMTGYTTPSGTVIYSSDSPPNRAWNAFDGSTSLTPAWYSAVNNTGWLGYQFTSPIIIDRYALTTRGAGDGYSPKDWTFQGSNDGITWTTIQTVTGHSGASITSPLLGNTTAYTRYRINITATISSASNPIILEFYMYELYYTNSGVAGGGFTLSTAQTITCTNTVGIVAGTTTCLTYSGASPTAAIINSTIYPSSNGSYVNTLRITGTGTLTINGNLFANTTQHYTVVVAANCILNIIGTVGSSSSSTNSVILLIQTTSTINITGNVLNGGSSTFLTIQTTGGSPTINITGNVIASGSSDAVPISLGGTNPAVYVTGNVTGASTNLNCNAIRSTIGAYINIVGVITAGASNGSPAVFSSSQSAINIFTGPFIFGNYGTAPFYVTRMFLNPTSTGYIEYRNNSTNGALPPGAIAPTVTWYPASTVADAPVPANVRSGVVYALGSQTGTLVVPPAGSVANGVVYDNGTIGTAVLTPAGVWDALTSTMSAPGSIGERLKNASTVATTGSQLAAFTS